MVKQLFDKNIHIYAIGSLCVILTSLLNNISYTLGSIFLFVLGIVLYLWLSLRERNFGALNSVFIVAIICPMALANLKLMDYQRVWGYKTWILYAVSILLFGVSYSITDTAVSNDNKEYVVRIKEKGEYKLFIINCILFAGALGGFLITAKICGFLPFFSTEIYNSYLKFYSKFLLISHFCIINIPLCYISLKMQEKLIFKIILAVFIFIQTFVQPILMVNRGIYMIGSLLLAFCIFYYEKRKLLIFLICMSITFVGYEVGSSARGYTTEMLSDTFKQASTESAPTEDTEVSKPIATNDSIIQENQLLPEQNGETEAESPMPSATTEMVQYDPKEVTYSIGDDVFTKKDENTFVAKPKLVALNTLPVELPAKLLFLYSYITVGYDNFDLTIKYQSDYTYGLKMLQCVDFVTKRIFGEPNETRYLVQFNLNSEMFLSTGYHDFGIVGSLLYLVIAGLLCGKANSYYKRKRSILSFLFLLIASYFVTLVFFANYAAQVIFTFNIVSAFAVYVLLKYIFKIV